MLDIKEPRQGALGRADWATIADVANVTSRRACSMSAALGELAEWLPSKPPCESAEQTSALRALSFVKLGLAGMRGRATLLDDFLAVVERVQSIAFESPQWIAVVYADWQVVNAPAPREVLTLVDQLRERSRIRVGGVLVDTSTKGEKRLFDFASIDELSSLRSATQERGLALAIAGRLRTCDLTQALAVNPDIIAVRSAVCGAGDRLNAVTEAAVASFREQLHAVVASRGVER